MRRCHLLRSIVVLIQPEARGRIYWTNVLIHTEVSVGHFGREWCIIVELRWGAARYPVGYAMKKTAAPIRFAGSQFDKSRHVCAFNSADEEHRLLPPFIKDRFRCGHKAIHVGTPDHLEQKPLSVPLNEFLRQFRHRRARRNSSPAAA